MKIVMVWSTLLQVTSLMTRKMANSWQANSAKKSSHSHLLASDIALSELPTLESGNSKTLKLTRKAMAM